MIKLEYVVFFLLFAGSGAYVWHFFRRLRRDHFSKLVERAFLRRQASGGENAFFCEPLLRRIVVLLLHDGKKALRPGGDRGRMTSRYHLWFAARSHGRP